MNADALACLGYGMLAAQGYLRRALDVLDWDPPRIMSTAFMWYLMGFDLFEGWVGIDQFDPSNVLAQKFHDAFVARHGASPPMWPNAIPVPVYDTARVLTEGLFRGPIPSGPGLKTGLESIRFMPSATGGPRTHIAGAPYEHGMFRGDRLLYGRVRNGTLEFEGLCEALSVDRAGEAAQEVVDDRVDDLTLEDIAEVEPREEHRGRAVRCRP